MLRGNFMQQRRLRLGDVLDDYCPRERRVTNHAVVAIVEDDVRQTRCTTCDAEHVYRHGKAPAARRPKPQGALVAEMPDGSRPHLAPVASRPAEPPLLDAIDVAAEEPHSPVSFPPPEDSASTAPTPLMAAAPSFVPDTPAEVVESPAVDDREDDGPVHRPLIRATFPRPEGHVPERREPEFTVRQPGSRGGREVDGNRAGFRGRGQQGQGFGGSRDFGGRSHGGGFGADGHRGGRGPGGRGGDRPGGGDPNRGQRHGGGAGRKGGR